jgi:hypothetical protein
MKKLTALFLLPILASALAANSYQNRDAPELPPEVAADIRSVPNTNLLMSVPYPDGYVDKALSTTTARDERDCGTIEFFWAQVTFPVTFCTPDPNLGMVTAYTGPGVAPPFDLPPPAADPKPAQNFKFSVISGNRLPDPFNCFTHSGPWLARVIYYRACDMPEKYSMEILGIPSCPGCLYFEYAPPFENHPSHINVVQGLGLPWKTNFMDCNPSDLTKCPGVPEPSPTPVPPPA